MRVSRPAVLLLALPGLLIAGCGSSSGGSNQQASGGSPAAASGSDIKLGLISTVQSQAFSFKDSAQAFQAAVESINASGGIKGHKVQAIVCNDQGEASVAAQCANTLINQDHVVALGGGISPVDGPVYAAAKPANVGVFCFSGVDAPAAQIPTYFACQGSTLGYVNIPLLFQPGWKTVTLVNYQGLPSTAPLIKHGMAALGSHASLRDIQASPTTVDWSPVIAEAKAQHTDAMITQLSASANLALLQAETAADVRIPLLGTSGQVETPTVKYAAANGIPLYVAGGYINEPSKSKLRAQELADLEKYEPSIDDNVSDTTAGAWLFPYLLRTGADNGSLTDFSRAGIVKWASSQTDLQTGFVAPLDWKNPGALKAEPRFTNLWAIPEKVSSSGQEVLLKNVWETLAGSKLATQSING